MAKKKVAKKAAGKRVKQPGDKKATAAEPAPQFVIFYELAGVAGVRCHGEFADLERARTVARFLVASPDVARAWILRDLEIVSKTST